MYKVSIVHPKLQHGKCMRKVRTFVRTEMPDGHRRSLRLDPSTVSRWWSKWWKKGAAPGDDLRRHNPGT